MSVTGLGRIAMADKMSVDQLKEALQNKTLPAYIAIPLIEEKMDMEEHMMRYRAMRGMGQQQPPIADAILARTAQPAGVDALPTNLPMAGMAGGGIVAFADGGMSDDDDDEEEDDSFDEAVDKENAELLRKLMAIRAMGAGQGIADLPVSSGAMGIDALGSGLRPTTAVGETEAPRTSLAAARTDSGMGLKAPKGHKYADQITAKAEQMGLDPKFALYIAGKERVDCVILRRLSHLLALLALCSSCLVQQKTWELKIRSTRIKILPVACAMPR